MSFLRSNKFISITFLTFSQELMIFLKEGIYKTGFDVDEAVDINELITKELKTISPLSFSLLHALYTRTWWLLHRLMTFFVFA